MLNLNKKYSIIYADPPWHYQTWGEGGNRNVTSKYKTMSPQEIWDLPVQNISAENSVLFIWVTYPKLLEGIKTISEWGFTYKTCGFSWVKLNKKKETPFIGLGYYTRANNEICLLATKGKPLKRQNNGVHQVVLDKIREHSRKPDCIRDRIVQLFGDLPRIELFARQKTPGWDVWGNEV